MPTPDRGDDAGLGGAVLGTVCGRLTLPLLDRLAPGSSVRPDRVSTALSHATTHGLLGTRCDIALHGPPGRLEAQGHADHVLGLPDARAVLAEGIRRYDGRQVLLLLPLGTAHTHVREQRFGALAGARFARLEVTALPVPDHALLGTVTQHAPLLGDAVAATRLSLARLLTDLGQQSVSDVLGYASRRPFQDGALTDRQAFLHALTEATAEVRMCHAVTRRAAAAGGPARWDRAVRAGVFVSRAVPKSVGTACRLFGGQGFMDGHPIAAAYREAVFAPVLLGGQRRLVDSMRERLAGHAPSPRTAGRAGQPASASLR
ncbi:hypothetical protein J7E96_14190 [Streptomyces sp. ISL-96]|uniref:acyl-CoA dehydrogenase family protein n=1 Tax=Streptomyces sp. ISL-96 TaxID=2819191 RepID=UPI001BE5A5EB|nr:acyl-CoA dehydrogenase family protein [Streptomyces sp. ISL-96]MBT2489645.1 hypothetical protein [Streptomyces sp. ISL-96]